MPEQRSLNDIIQAFKDHVAQISAVSVNANGEPDISATARSCQFDRRRFRTNLQLSEALRDVIGEEGLESLDQGDRCYLEDEKLRQAEEDIKRLRERVDGMQTEIKAKSDCIRELAREITKTSHQEILTLSGPA